MIFISKIPPYPSLTPGLKLGNSKMFYFPVNRNHALWHPRSLLVKWLAEQHYQLTELSQDVEHMRQEGNGMKINISQNVFRWWEKSSISECPTVYISRSGEVHLVRCSLCAQMSSSSRLWWLWCHPGAMAQCAQSAICSNCNMFQMHWTWWTQTGLISFTQWVSYVWDKFVSLCRRCGMQGC